jgi:hypothetical protein
LGTGAEDENKVDVQAGLEMCCGQKGFGAINLFWLLGATCNSLRS